MSHQRPRLGTKWDGDRRGNPHPNRRSLIGLVISLPAAALTTGCGGLERGAPAPAALSEQITVLGISNARFWPDTQSAAMADEAARAVQRERALSGNAAGTSSALGPAHYLSLSGGGEDGAFGAGLLSGWSDTGAMPDFKLVTGVSTGALIAPVVFLRPYREQLRALYTSIRPGDVFEKRGLYGALFGDSLADTAPLSQLISRYVSDQMLNDIAQEYQRDRLLLIGTTSLDQQRPVIWNIGAIAASRQPGALELVRNIIRAASAIPGVFPPVMIDVEAGGRRYQEMAEKHENFDPTYMRALYDYGYRRGRNTYPWRKAPPVFEVA